MPQGPGALFLKCFRDTVLPWTPGEPLLPWAGPLETMGAKGFIGPSGTQDVGPSPVGGLKETMGPRAADGAPW